MGSSFNGIAAVNADGLAKHGSVDKTSGVARTIVLLLCFAAPALGAERVESAGHFSQQRDPPSALARTLPPPKNVDVRRAAAAGVRLIESKHLRLFTDLPSSPAIDELPRVFDEAVPLWAEHFGIPLSRANNWRVQGFLVDDRERFESLDLLPRDNPIFINGYAHAVEFWFVEQPSDYYRRHLLLHEGTHCFMYSMLGANGPGWFMEGMAELLGTHEWNAGKLKIGIVPKSNDDVPMWGRIKLIRDAKNEGRILPIEAVLQLDNRRGLNQEQYGWAWAFASFLDRNPAYQTRFRSLKEHVADPTFNDRFRELFADDWDNLQCEWRAHVAALRYGHDVAAAAMVHRTATPVGERARSAQILARGGWQSTGFLLSADREYEVVASGRFRIADDGQPWVSEPGGVTIDYYDGRPLGILLGALRPIASADSAPRTQRGFNKDAANQQDAVDETNADDQPADPDFVQPTAIGLQTVLRPTRDAVLYVRVNDHPGRLDDNSGEVVVTVRLR